MSATMPRNRGWSVVVVDVPEGHAWASGHFTGVRVRMHHRGQPVILPEAGHDGHGLASAIYRANAWRGSVIHSIYMTGGPNADSQSAASCWWAVAWTANGALR